MVIWSVCSLTAYSVFLMGLVVGPIECWINGQRYLL